MARWRKHYFFFGPKPAAMSPVQSAAKLAYTSAIGLGALSLLTGIVPLQASCQFSWLAFLFGRISSHAHLAFRGDVPDSLAFIPGHLIMVAPAQLVKFLLHAFRLEARARVPGVRVRPAVDPIPGQFRSRCSRPRILRRRAWPTSEQRSGDSTERPAWCGYEDADASP